jgi:hypothetical protein
VPSAPVPSWAEHQAGGARQLPRPKMGIQGAQPAKIEAKKPNAMGKAGKIMGGDHDFLIKHEIEKRRL